MFAQQCKLYECEIGKFTILPDAEQFIIRQKACLSIRFLTKKCRFYRQVSNTGNSYRGGINNTGNPCRKQGASEDFKIVERRSLPAAIANDPPVVIADEPTGNLDSANARDLHQRVLLAMIATALVVLAATELHDHLLLALAVAFHRGAEFSTERYRDHAGETECNR